MSHAGNSFIFHCHHACADQFREELHVCHSYMLSIGLFLCDRSSMLLCMNQVGNLFVFQFHHACSCQFREELHVCHSYMLSIGLFLCDRSSVLLCAGHVGNVFALQLHHVFPGQFHDACSCQLIKPSNHNWFNSFIFFCRRLTCRNKQLSSLLFSGCTASYDTC